MFRNGFFYGEFRSCGKLAFDFLLSPFGPYRDGSYWTLWRVRSTVPTHDRVSFTLTHGKKNTKHVCVPWKIRVFNNFPVHNFYRLKIPIGSMFLCYETVVCSLERHVICNFSFVWFSDFFHYVLRSKIFYSKQQKL